MEWKTLLQDEKVLQSIDAMGYTTPTKIQELVIPHVLKDEDVLVSSPTGSGKSASFLLPLFEKIQVEVKQPYALIIVPTRELALQIQKDAHILGTHKHIKTVALVGKSSFPRQRQELSQRAHIVVGTPGRVYDHIQEGTFDTSNLHTLVIDEVDELCRKGFFSQVESIWDIVKAKQIITFSATYPQDIKELLEKRIPNHQSVDIKEENKQLVQRWITCKSDDIKVISYILSEKTYDRVLIFVNERRDVEDIVEEFSGYRLKIRGLHGEHESEQRDRTLDAFRTGKIRILVTTNVLARGIDIAEVDCIINAVLPWKIEEYIHRIGRTARNEASGICFSIVYDGQQRKDEFYEALDTKPELLQEEDIAGKIMLDAYQVSRPRMTQKDSVLIENTKLLYIKAGKKKKVSAKDIVGACMQLEGISFEDIGRIDIRDHVSYLEILGGKEELVLKGLQTQKIKGQLRSVEFAHTQGFIK